MVINRPKRRRGAPTVLDLGMRQADVAKGINVSQTTLSRMLKGTRAMSDDDLEAIVRVVGDGYRDALKKVQKKPAPPLA
jgi:transcriptional regulator with XRE-family HTH domain